MKTTSKKMKKTTKKMNEDDLNKMKTNIDLKK